MDKIIVRGARVHNLKSVNCEIPKNKFIVVSGVSGSGKSSFAFDTLYAEGQRRYVESLSSYARQFLGVISKPEVDFIDGLSPAIAIEQRSISKNPRSTIGTATEIYDYLRVLYAKAGDIKCPNCGREVRKMSLDEIIADVLLLKGEQATILSPVVRSKKGEFRDLIKKFAKKGFTRIVIDGKHTKTSDEIQIDKNKSHSIELVIDRLTVNDNAKRRLTQSIELALKEAEGLVYVQTSGGEKRLYNERLACPDCSISFDDITPRSFSFNSPYGACPDCHGLGTIMDVDEESVIANESLSILEGAISPWGDPSRRQDLVKLSKRMKFDLNTPYAKLTPEVREVVLRGVTEADEARWGIDFNFESVLDYLKRMYISTESEWVHSEVSKYTVFAKCRSCGGSRLKKESLSVYVGGKNINDTVSMDISTAYNWFSKEIRISKEREKYANELISDILKKLSFLKDVGVEYLTLDRSMESLSGGEAQRVRLATQIGSGLTDVLYVLDEPSIGLHQRDVGRLIGTLKKLRDKGNSIIVVEHDRHFMDEADYIIDFGLYAGEQGGEIIYAGDSEHLLKSERSLTAKYLSGKEKIFIEKEKRKREPGYEVTVRNATEHNLKGIDVSIPLGLFVCITGVSGSGKSTLVNDILYSGLKKHFRLTRKQPGSHQSIDNMHLIDKVIDIDQTPIGRTPRSNPATYTGLFTPIRELFTELQEAKIRGYKAGRFSFNVKGGRCEACEGDGYKRIEMYFLPDVFVTCDVCRGKRFNEETLQVKFKNKNIAEVLDMSVDEALKHFEGLPKIENKLKLLSEVGLGYIKLGQPATSLSGGEAQRIKLARELSKQDTGRTLYILDEPTTGLHFHDTKLLLKVLDRLVKKGNTLVVIEHNLDVIRFADWIIDMGPEGGEKGGEIIVQGTLEQVISCRDSHTGRYLKKETI
ncbi:MAG: excinuclease ABC subunit UvrA [bacterium]